MDLIKKWLDSETQDYEEGLTLLRKYSRNRTLVNILSRKENTANREKLAYELGKVEVPATDQDQDEPTAPNPSSPVPVNPATPSPAEPLDLLIAEMQRLYTERCHLSNTLADILSDDVRAQVAGDILKLQEDYNALAEKKTYFEAHGHFPEAVEKSAGAQTPDASNDKAELIGSLSNLRSQRSKAKAALAKHPDDVLKQEKLAKLDANK